MSRVTEIKPGIFHVLGSDGEVIEVRSNEQPGSRFSQRPTVPSFTVNAKQEPEEVIHWDLLALKFAAAMLAASALGQALGAILGFFYP